MKKFLLILVASFVLAGVAPIATKNASAQEPDAREAKAVALAVRDECKSTLAALAGKVDSLKTAIDDKEKAEKKGVKKGTGGPSKELVALKAQIAKTQAAYSELKSEMDKGEGVKALAEVHAKAMMALKDSEFATAAYLGLQKGPSATVAAKAAGHKCPDGTAPVQFVRSASVPGIGDSSVVEFKCTELHSPTVGEKESDRIKARNEGAKFLAEAERARLAASTPSLTRHLVVGGIGAALAATSAYLIGAWVSPKGEATRNGGAAAGITACIAAGIVALTAPSSGDR